MNKLVKHILRSVCVIALLTLVLPQLSFAQSPDGEALFKANCASCHKPDVAFVGPELKGAREREPSKGWVYEWVRNATAMASTDPYAIKMKEEHGGIVMTSFPDMTNEEIDAILDWAENYQPGGAAGAAEGGAAAAAPQESDHTLLYGFLTLILAIVALVLVQVNRNLKKISKEVEGMDHEKKVSFFRNKNNLMIFAIVLFGAAGYFLVEGAVGLGRQQGYQPEQPIYYSHMVHAGVNQISCLYCHGGAQDSKHANIPSVNVCMNCHLSVSEYTGDPIVREDGSTVDANAEIQKLYKYAGFNPETKKYDEPGKPIVWNRIHNLPAHVYFNHSQHVRVGKVACQTCHGDVQDMNEVKQFATLSMGWCVNCHRETNVQFNDDKGNGNEFYSIYEKFHNEISSGKYDSVTVEKIGGTECAKCHY